MRRQHLKMTHNSQECYFYLVTNKSLHFYQFQQIADGYHEALLRGTHYTNRNWCRGHHKNFLTESS